MDWVYSETVKDHFTNPRNVFSPDEHFEENGTGTVGNVKCGDQMEMRIKVDASGERIEDCRWRTYGCASAIASTSLLSEYVKGKTLKEAWNISPKDLAAELGGLPENKIHCSVLGDKALRAAINDYYRRSGREDLVSRDEAKTICQCMNVTDHDIEEAVLEGARTYLELQEHTKLGTVCGQCKDEAAELMHTYIHMHFE